MSNGLKDSSPNRQLNIAMFSHSFGSLTTTFIRNEVQFFAEKHKLIYLATAILDHDANAMTIEIPFQRSKLVSKLRWWLWQLDLSCDFRNENFKIQLESKLKNVRPDVMHMHFGYEALMFLQNIEPGPPVLIHFHGYDASQMLRKKSYIRALNTEIRRHDAQIIYVSENMLQKLERGGVVFRSGFLLRYGIDLDKFAPVHTTVFSDKFRIVQVSSLAEKKGHVYTLKAIRRALDIKPELREKLEVVFSGGGANLVKLRYQAEELGIDDVIAFIGNINSDEVVSLLATANAFVHHSVTASNGDQEGIPNAIMEAMAMELPVLSTQHAGIPELVEHGKNGLLCAEMDIETFAQHIIQIVGWTKLSVNREVINERFNMIKHNHELLDIYIESVNWKIKIV